MPQYHHHQRRQLYNSGMNIAGVVHRLPLLLQLLLLVVVQHDSTNHVAMVQAVRNVQVVFPLQSLTIWDPEVVLSNRKEDRNIDVETQSSSSSSPPPPPPPLTFRAKFLSKFQKGLQAEVQTRNMLLLQQQEQGVSSSSSNGNMSVSSAKKGTTAVSLHKKQQKHWATQAALNDQKKHELRESIVEQAYDNAIQQHQKELEEQLDVVQKKKHRKNPNRYQFVGVINHQPPTHSKETSSSPLPPITWYTRTKPKHAKWTIRLIHVNRAAILKDLYNQKKIDIFAQYQNKGTTTTTTTTSLQPQVTGQYRVRERSWKNLWNMSLKHMLTDSSGMYWRERRIHSMHGNDHQHPNLYTDGNHVYEATYRYIPDGRNGMHKVSTLTEFLNSRSIDPKIKQRIVQRLQNDTPDIVLEE